ASAHLETRSKIISHALAGKMAPVIVKRRWRHCHCTSFARLVPPITHVIYSEHLCGCESVQHLHHLSFFWQLVIGVDLDCRNPDRLAGGLSEFEYLDSRLAPVWRPRMRRRSRERRGMLGRGYGPNPR